MTLAAVEERYERLPLATVVPSKTNPRTHFDDGYLAQLAASIGEKGVVQPILVRPFDGTAGFEIIAGECRYRASLLAKQASIPAIVRAYTDDQVLELQLVENIHRKDLTALEQAVGYRKLITQNAAKHSAATIAQRLGMSEAWVWDRLKLNDLVPAAKALLERGLMTTGHAILVSRQTPKNQEKLIDPKEKLLFEPGLDAAPINGGKPDPYDHVKACSVRELEVAIADHIRFDVAHAAKAAPLLFGETAAAVEAAKRRAEPTNERGVRRGPKVLAITFDHQAADSAKDPSERTYGYSSWRRADGTKKTTPVNGYSKQMKDSPTCGFSVLGVVVAGSAHYGETFQVCVNRDKCAVHFGTEIKARERDAKARARGQSKQADRRATVLKAKEAKEAAANRARTERWQQFVPALKKAVLAAAEKTPAKLPRHVFVKMLESRGLPPATKPEALAKALLLVSVKNTFDRAWSTTDEPRLVAWAKALGVNPKTCEPKAVAGKAAKAS